jgi:hypothetical protein
VAGMIPQATIGEGAQKLAEELSSTDAFVGGLLLVSQTTSTPNEQVRSAGLARHSTCATSIGTIAYLEPGPCHIVGGRTITRYPA